MDKQMFDFYKNALQGVISDPLCADYKNDWRGCGDNKGKLAELVMRQQSLPYFFSYCHNGLGVSKEYVLDEFGDYINGRYTGIDVDGVEGGYKTELYVGHTEDVSIADDVAAFMWCDLPSLYIQETKATKIYVGCSSTVRLVCGGYNNVTVMLFDDSRIILDDIDPDSRVVVFRYSTAASVEVYKFCLSHKIDIFDKELKI